ncbi:acetyl-CoA carboxylase biotin carboxyl carrier protein subunit [Salegentibacter sp. HM20]
MEKRYKVKVNDAFDFEFSKEEITALDTQVLSEKNYHLLQQNRGFTAQIHENDFLNRSYTVKINANAYKVQISNELDLLIEEMGLSLGSAQMVNDIKAPMPGLILEVNVEEGREVKEGDYLLVLEAMKMENTLTAPRDGVVKTVSIKQGETVEKNQLLIEME